METGKSGDICKTLKREILSGKFDGTRKLPSEHMLMRRFSVARETVRAALRELQVGKLVERRLGQGTFLTSQAEGLATGRFGVIVPDAYYPFYARICAGIEGAARAHGWSVLSVALGSGDMNTRAQKALEFAELCCREKVGGVFFQPLQFMEGGEAFNERILGVLRTAGIPVVLLDSDYVPPPRRSAYDLVGLDNVHVGYLLARHMIACGAKRLWYFSNPLPAPTSLDRGNGVGMAVAEAGLAWRRESVFFANPRDTRAARRLFAGRNRPDAIVAVNDFVAVQLLKTLKEIGKRVPEDVRLAGVNGDDVAAETEPPLTTAVQPCEQIGQSAVNLMMQRIEHPDLAPRRILLTAELLPRQSTLPTGKSLSKNKRSKHQVKIKPHNKIQPYKEENQ